MCAMCWIQFAYIPFVMSIHTRSGARVRSLILEFARFSVYFSTNTMSFFGWCINVQLCVPFKHVYDVYSLHIFSFQIRDHFWFHSVFYVYSYECDGNILYDPYYDVPFCDSTNKIYSAFYTDTRRLFGIGML